MDKKQAGNLGERIAENFLKKKGYQILGKNYSPRFVSGPQRGEIDIIAKKQDVICFVEVKTLIQNRGGLSSASSVFRPEEKVNFQKQKRIIKAVESWILENKISGDTKLQIDAIAIIINPAEKKAKIRHFKNIMGQM